MQGLTSVENLHCMSKYFSACSRITTHDIMTSENTQYSAQIVWIAFDFFFMLFCAFTINNVFFQWCGKWHLQKCLFLCCMKKKGLQRHVDESMMGELFLWVKQVIFCQMDLSLCVFLLIFALKWSELILSGFALWWHELASLSTGKAFIG